MVLICFGCQCSRFSKTYKEKCPSTTVFHISVAGYTKWTFWKQHTKTMYISSWRITLIPQSPFWCSMVLICFGCQCSRFSKTYKEKCPSITVFLTSVAGYTKWTSWKQYTKTMYIASWRITLIHQSPFWCSMVLICFGCQCSRFSKTYKEKCPSTTVFHISVAGYTKWTFWKHNT